MSTPERLSDIWAKDATCKRRTQTYTIYQCSFPLTLSVFCLGRSAGKGDYLQSISCKNIELLVKLSYHWKSLYMIFTCNSENIQRKEMCEGFKGLFAYRDKGNAGTYFRGVTTTANNFPLTCGVLSELSWCYGWMSTYHLFCILKLYTVGKSWSLFLKICLQTINWVPLEAYS